VQGEFVSICSLVQYCYPIPFCILGQCTWGSSCRFVHPGVLDKGNYSMFAPPRPILAGSTAASELPEIKSGATSPTAAAPLADVTRFEPYLNAELSCTYLPF
jgi:hypothetical protein